MATVLAPDSAPAAQEVEPSAPPEGTPGATAPSPVETPPPANVPAGLACASCGAELSHGQDWCLQCGTGAPSRGPGSGWRPAATVLIATALLVLGAAAAGYAALTKNAPKRKVVTVAAVTPPAASTPVPGTTTPPVTGLPGATTPGGAAIVKPPKIPLTATTPKALSVPTGTGGATSGGSSSTGTETSKESSNQTSTTGTGGSSSESKPTPLLLDTDAASTYNPYNYPATDFGDPSLTIDGDTATGWTAQVNPATAPALAEGVLINLKTAQKVSAVELVTSSPGMTVQVYGTTAHTAPTSITDPAWTAISRAVVVKKHHTLIKLRDKKKGFVQLTLWISKAGAASVGTPAAPGHVTIDELEVFPVS